jgi:ABC-type glutathione transport system ATPase component
MALFDIQNLTVGLRHSGGWRKILRDLTFRVNPGEILAIVGETGAGKSVLIWSLMGLLPQPMRFLAGSISLEDRNLLELDEKEWADLRGKEMALIPQNPGAALPSIFRFRRIVRDFWKESANPDEGLQRFSELAERMGLPGKELPEMYPFQLSGGMQQRAILALALLNRPKILLADEPTSALDLPVQVQILGLLRRLKEELGVSVLLVSHDLGAVARVADRIGVLYRGELVEINRTNAILSHPAHSYTKRLLEAAQLFAW